jgi:hypothetical protein
MVSRLCIWYWKGHLLLWELKDASRPKPESISFPFVTLHKLIFETACFISQVYGINLMGILIKDIVSPSTDHYHSQSTGVSPPGNLRIVVLVHLCRFYRESQGLPVVFRCSLSLRLHISYPWFRVIVLYRTHYHMFRDQRAGDIGKKGKRRKIIYDFTLHMFFKHSHHIPYPM